MPPIIIALLAGAGLYVGYKFLSARARPELKRPAGKPAARSMAKNLGELERDPKTGEYRPRKPH